MPSNDNATAANFRSRLRTGLMPAIGSKRKASAIDPSGPPRKGFALCAVWWLTVWMVMVTGVDRCPPEEWPARRSRSRPPGKPLALKVSASV
jgi:hypothetical protein